MIINDLLNHIKQHQLLPSPVDLKLPCNKENTIWLDSTYLTRVNVLKFANLFQSRNKIKLRHICKFIKIIFSKNTSSWLVTSLSFFVVFLLCYVHPLAMCVQILILNVCIYLCTIVMHWFMRILKSTDCSLVFVVKYYYCNQSLFS